VGFEVGGGTGTILTFEGTPYAGLEVKVDEPPIGLLLEIGEKYAALTSGGEASMQGQMKLIGDLIAGFAQVLEEWNVTRKGEPVPATLEGLRLMGHKFVVAVIGAWFTGSVAVDEDLGKGSASGGTSPEELAATAALSSSPLSSEPQRLLSACATGGTCCRRRSWPSQRGCCGCSTSTRSATGTKRVREVR
jgi:hypothetical protein